MPAISPPALVEAIISAIEDSGYSAILLSAIRSHPRKFAITRPDEASVIAWVYVWTLTHGGRPSLPDEYRIQITSVTSPMPLNPNGPTVLLGYQPNLGLFAGFDLVRHRTFTPGSPSVQIDINAVRNARSVGLTFDRKTNDEIAVGIRPDQLVNYILNAEHLHRFGSRPDTFNLLTRAAAVEEIAEAEIAALPEERRRIVQVVTKLSRKGNFKQKVLFAYGHRCAVTKAQLRLVDTAHILPVGAPESNDAVNNGLALAPTYHRAFDNALIYLTENYEMRLNSAKKTELAAVRLDGGLDGFKSHLGRILLPPDRNQWPSKELIRKANRYRRIG